MEPEKDPMPLENLPSHLKSLKEKRSVAPTTTPVVGMGQIVQPKKSYAWAKMLFTLIMCVSLGAAVVMTYRSMGVETLTVVVDIDQQADPSLVIPKIVSESGGDIVAVKQMGGSTYQIKVSTRNGKDRFMEWLLKNRDVKRASWWED